MGIFGNRSPKPVAHKDAVSKRTNAAPPGARSQKESDRDNGKFGKKRKTK